MSRIGKMPIALPAGVTVEFQNGVVTVKGPKGTLVRTLHPDMKIVKEEGQVTVERPSDVKEHRALHGLTRALINNMIIGVEKGFGLADEYGAKAVFITKDKKIIPSDGLELEISVTFVRFGCSDKCVRVDTVRYCNLLSWNCCCDYVSISL